VDRLVVAGRVLLSLSSHGKYLRGWSMKDGTLMWEAVTYTAAAPSAEAALEKQSDRGVDLLVLGRDADDDGVEDVAVLVRGEVQLRSLADGIVSWTAEAGAKTNDDSGSNDAARFDRLAIGAGDTILALGATATRGHPIACELDPGSGNVKRIATASGVSGLDLSQQMTVSGSDTNQGLLLFGAAREPGASAGDEEVATKLFVVDVEKLLALSGSKSSGKDVGTVFAPETVSLDLGSGAVFAEPVRGVDGASDVAAARSGSALVRGSEKCALVTVDSFAGEFAKLKPADRVRVVQSWALDSGGNCPAAVSPATLVERVETKTVTKKAPAAKRAALRVAVVVADVETNVFTTSTTALEGAVFETKKFVTSTAATPLDRGGSRSAWLVVDGLSGTARVLATTADASLRRIDEKKSAPIWVREESVAMAGEVKFARLPPPKSAAAAAAEDLSVRPTLKESLATQILAAKARFGRATKSELATLTAQRRSRGDKLLPTRDANGFRAQILFLSPDGSLVSLHNGDGRMLWRLFLGGGVDTAGDANGAYRYSVLLPWKDALLGEGEERVLVLGTAYVGGLGGAKKTRAVVIDAYTGAVAWEEVLPFEAAHVLPLPSASEAGSHDGSVDGGYSHGAPSAMLLVDAHAPSARVFPDTDDARRAASIDRQRVSFFTVDQEKSEVRGYALMPDVSGSGHNASFGSTHSPEDPSTYATTQIWTTKFPHELGSIVGYASKPGNEPVHTWVKVLGDRSTLFKYLSPNVIFVAVAPIGAAANREDAAVSAHLLDAATGRVLYRVRHPEARGPVHAVVCENWVVYHYFNTRAGRNTMSVLELFDDSEHRKGVAAGTLMMNALTSRSTENKETVSSFAPPPLRIMGQSYFVRPSATSLTATYSAKGVTQHQVLMGTGTDQVVALDKRWLDPRRPTKPSRETQEEGLLPYAEVLPIAPQAWVTTKHQVARLKGVVTAPANLESTVLCVAHGLDVFFTR
jgi:hypothetical protein|tara:strand:- start:5783 stop:8725 length:2943 start_codon:yes stop_codon:yes gene_type:complete